MKVLEDVIIIIVSVSETSSFSEMMRANLIIAIFATVLLFANCYNVPPPTSIPAASEVRNLPNQKKN